MASNRLIVVRGPSGSGKSSIGKYLFRDAMHHQHEADQFFQDDEARRYNFDYTKLEVAHRWCQANVERDLYMQRPLVVVSNTSMSQKEVIAYQKLAYVYRFEFHVIRTPKPWDIDALFQRNVHGVPRDIIERQIQRYQPMNLETEWSNMEIF